MLFPSYVSLLLLCLPDLRRTVVASGSYHLPIGRPERLPDGVAGTMTGVGVDMPGGRGTPDVRRAVVAARNNLCIIRRPRYRPDTLGVAVVYGQLATGRSIPHLSGRIPTAGSYSREGMRRG